MGKVVDKSGLTGVVNFSLIAGAVSMALLGAAYGMPLIILSAVLKAFSQGGGQISLQTACIKKRVRQELVLPQALIILGQTSVRE